MTKIMDNNRIYKITKENESAEYPPNQISVVIHGDNYDRLVDIYGIVKDNAVFERNAETFGFGGAYNMYVRNHTNKKLKLLCEPVERGDSEQTSNPNSENHFDTDNSIPVRLTITVLEVINYNKSPQDIKGFVY